MVIIWINEKLINLTRRTKQTNYIESEAGRSRFDSIFFEEKKSTREFAEKHLQKWEKKKR